MKMLLFLETLPNCLESVIFGTSQNKPAQLCRAAEDDTLENWVQKYCFSAITIITIAEQPQKPTAAARSYY